MPLDEKVALQEAPNQASCGRPSLSGAHDPIVQPAAATAQEFLRALDGLTRNWDFRTFDDNPRRKDPNLTRVFKGTLDEVFPQLVRLNEMGAGVFVTINRSDGRGIRARNIHRIRAIFADADGVDVSALLALRPHMVVRSSPGRYHCYWLVEDCEVADFKPKMKAIAAKFGTDPKVSDPSRVMRLPGFLHRKGEPYLVDFDHDLVAADGAERPAYTVEQIVTGLGLGSEGDRAGGCTHSTGKRAKSGEGAASQRCGPAPPPADIMRAKLGHLVRGGHFEDRTGVKTDVQGRIVKLSWIETGMALKLAYGADGQDLWAVTHHNERAYDDAPGQWASFAVKQKPGHVTIGTIIKAARDAGYVDAASQATIAIELFWAFMPTHQYIFAPTGELWPAASVNGRLPPVVIDVSAGDPETMSPSRWLDRNKPIEQMTWTPGEPQVIRDRLAHDGELVEHFGAACFNTYRPPAHQAGGDASAVAPWLDHIQKVYSDEADHIVRWLAHRVQRPQEKINHALVLGGVQGIGKDTILAPIKAAIGPWNFQETSPQQVIGRFNGFLKAVILRVSEARDLGDVNRFQFYDHMKVYLSSPPETLRVDEKNIREYYIRNCCGVILTSNHKTDGIFLPPDDRRHFVLWSACSREDFSEKYWNRLWHWYEHGGCAHVGAYLATVDLSSFDSKAPPPRTTAFWEIVEANRPPEDAELADAIDAIGKPEALTLESLRGTSAGFGSWMLDRKNRRVIPHRLEKCGYAPVRNEAAGDGLWKIAGHRRAIYARAELPPRERLRAAHTLLGR